MMNWNHRVVRRTYRGTDPYYAIHEVYYTDGVPDSVTTDAIAPMGETVEELREELQMMLRALDAPVLDYEDIANREPKLREEWEPGEKNPGGRDDAGYVAEEET